jgi:glycosyltransferase involved in cell wall biosynthesis
MFSVILCVHNGEPWLSEQLASLARQTFVGDWELVVVDDRSTDGSGAVANAWADRLPVRVVNVESGAGASNARNVGSQAARGEYLIFCDADDVADEQWLESMAVASEAADVIGGGIEEVLLNDESIREWRTPFTPGKLPVAFGRWPCPPGANFGMRASLLVDIGGFDPLLPTGEEVDVAIRAHLAGHPTLFVPEAVMHYRHRGSMRQLARQSYRYGTGNVQMYQRYGAQGVAPTPVGDIAKSFLRLAKGVPGAVVSRRRRGSWIRYASYLAGQSVGCVRYRVRWIG